MYCDGWFKYGRLYTLYPQKDFELRPTFNISVANEGNLLQYL